MLEVLVIMFATTPRAASSYPKTAIVNAKLKTAKPEALSPKPPNPKP